MPISEGNPQIVIGLIDGPINFDHPAFQDSRMGAVNESQIRSCNRL